MDFFAEDLDFPKELNAEAVSQWIAGVISGHDKTEGEISVIFCSDNYLLRINQEALNHDYYTDVITFDYTEGGVVSGDLFISVDRVKENSGEYRVEFLTELLRVIVHGILHLLGFTDKDDAAISEMRQLENKWLDVFVSRET